MFQRLYGIVQSFTAVTCGNPSVETTNVTSTCYKFVLTIPVVQALNGTTVMCEDAISAHTVGNGNSFDVQTREYRSVW